MERIPGSQPKNLEHEDISDLATIGHVIEVWEDAKNTPGEIDDRIGTLRGHLTRYLVATEHFDDAVKNEIIEDAIGATGFEGSELEFKDYCQERVRYWTEVRRQFIENEL